jgi:outer membrane receptor for ferrienterochelin and colicin
MQYVYFLLLSLPFAVSAQRSTVSGIISEKGTGENLIGASVFNTSTLQGTTSNTYGFYSLTLSGDSVNLRFSYVGYQSASIRFHLKGDTTINIALENADMLQEVEVTASSEDEIQNSTRMGTIDIPIEQIKSMPALLGETDVFKVLQLLPGVQSGAEGSSGLYVRGGGPEQNLILLDGVPVYNASHLFGFFSVFNADAINHVELIKGGFPARYGGRLSSVIDISMKEGDQQKIKGEGSIGLIASRLTIEGPIKKNTTSFIVSGRRTYIDLLARPLIQASSEGDAIGGYYFYDLNAKINHKINDRNRIYLSTYMGDDKAYARYREAYQPEPDRRVEYEDSFGLKWGNITTALRWNKIVNNKLFTNLTATYSRYRFNVFTEYEEVTTENSETEKYYYKAAYNSGIRDYALKLDFDYLPSPDHYIKFGAQTMRHLFTPGVFNFVSTEQSDTTLGPHRIFATESLIYIEDDIRLSDRLKLNAGIHASGFNVRGKFYGSIQPRVSGRFLISPALSAKASFAQMTQYIHLLTNSGIGLPTDLWVPATPLVGPEKSYQTSVGTAYNLKGKYEISLEAYYKKMEGLIEYKEGASYVDIEGDWQTKVESGEGFSYGTELFLQKKTGRISGWVGYTLSWTNRTFENINFGKTFPYRYDRRHDTEIAFFYDIASNKNISLTWVYGTGAAVSLPLAEYPSAEQNNPFSFGEGNVKYYDGRNQYRMAAYHRLDAGYTIKKKTKWGERSWTFGIYNMYNRRNPFFIDIGRDNDGKKRFIQYSLFPLIPSFAYHFKF